ncbi:hypothetical protein GF359_09635 [candidate division WOR-3 bacterium]|uniref:Thioredoxin domain-containing protein n=1 Tax=candidate division WOR-3 bacterium TaxID=2052148 RepID=A0A9D5QEY3_UNCW3|nr:hypothetical protein [candidate division WOR-3 bacterium]MBD3365460.1 hypothetical protein [candidate division WOR-3 bacterium]
MTLIVASGCGERFPDPSQEGEFERTVFLEEATGTWCVNCPAVAANIEVLLDEHPDELIVLALHSQTQDPYASDETEARLSDFGVAAFPTVIFDGVEAFEGVQTVEAMAQILQHRQALGSPLMIEVEATEAADSVSWKVGVIVSSLIEESIDGYLRIALVEDTLTDESAGLLHHVVRRLPEADAPVRLNPGDTLEFDRTLALETNWGRPLIAVAWIEDANHEVYQAASNELGGGNPDMGDFSIDLDGDSIQILPVSQIGQSVNFNFTLQNHTQNPLTLTLDLPEILRELPEHWSFSLCDETICYSVPSDFDLPASGLLEGLHLAIGTSAEDEETEGTMVLTAASGEEIDTQVFILRIE